MAKQKRLSQAEWELMDCIWQASEEVPVRAVVDLLYPNGEKAYTTVQTVMNILVDKGFLKRRKMGPVNIYSPKVTREEATREETESLVSRMFQGSFGTLATYLVDSGKLSDEELEKVRAMIEEKGRRTRKGES